MNGAVGRRVPGSSTKKFAKRSEKPAMTVGAEASEEQGSNFIREIIERDLAEGKNDGRLMTRFPPEPNGYLHIGHAKSICLNFGIAQTYPGAVCNLRFDDTNPAAEDVEYVESIKADVRWLGFDWETREYYASDYFEQLYQFALQLIRQGQAYVDSQTQEQIREMRGDFYRKGTNSPYRERSIEENLDLFARMRAGEFSDGAHVLRAKIDMASPDLNLRDPLMYRIRNIAHHRTGTQWCIYPIYDFAHGLCDAIEGVTHSICTLEFRDHRALYDWFIAAVKPKFRPIQYEFARLNLTYTVLSKRRLQELVKGGHVQGWDDPRMPTLSGMRRRGFTPKAIRDFCEQIGVTKRDTIVDVALLEHRLREDLNATAPRVMGVLQPLRVVIENFPENHVEEFDAPYHPQDPSFGARKVPLSRVVYIEREDFSETPPPKWQRLAPGREVRLRYACLITCREVVRDACGEIVEVRCTWDPESRGGMPADGRKVKGTLHWVSAAQGVPAQVRLYDRLFQVENPMDVAEGETFLSTINPHSLEVLTGCCVEPSLKTAKPGDRFQFERLGYFNCDPLASKPGALVFNRTITLRDTWVKQKSDS